MLSENSETGDVEHKEVLETYENETEELIHVHVGGEDIVTTPFQSTSLAGQEPHSFVPVMYWYFLMKMVISQASRRLQLIWKTSMLP